MSNNLLKYSKDNIPKLTKEQNTKLIIQYLTLRFESSSYLKLVTDIEKNAIIKAPIKMK